MVNDLMLHNTTEPKKYRIPSYGSFNYNRTTGTSPPIAFPGDNGENAIVSGLEGGTQTASLDFLIAQSSTDMSDGDNILTVKQQREYLEDYFIYAAIDQKVDIYTGVTFPSTASYDDWLIGRIQGGTFVYMGGGIVCQCSIKYVVGSVLG